MAEIILRGTGGYLIAETYTAPVTGGTTAFRSTISVVVSLSCDTITRSFPAKTTLNATANLTANPGLRLPLSASLNAVSSTSATITVKVPIGASISASTAVGDADMVPKRLMRLAAAGEVPVSAAAKLAVPLATAAHGSVDFVNPQIGYRYAASLGLNGDTLAQASSLYQNLKPLVGAFAGDTYSRGRKINVKTGLGLDAIRHIASWGSGYSTEMGTSFSFNKPAGTTAGDLMICAFTCPGSVTPTTPSGWTVVYNTFQWYGTNNKLVVYYRVCGASDPSSWSVGGLSNYTYGSVMVATYRNNVPASGGWAVLVQNKSAKSNATGTSHPSAAISTTVENSQHILICSGWHNMESASTFNAPSGYVKDANYNGMDGVLTFFSKLVPTASSVSATPTTGYSTPSGVVALAITCKEAFGFRGKNDASLTTSSSARTISVTKPTGLVAKDVLVASVFLDSPTATVTPVQNGWQLAEVASNAQGQLHVFVRAYDASDPESYGFTINADGVNVMATVEAYYGVCHADPISGAAGLADASPRTSHVTAPYTTYQRHEGVLAICGQFGNATLTAPMGEAAAMATRSDATTGNLRLAVYDDVWTPIGTITGRTITSASATTALTVMLGLNPRPAYVATTAAGTTALNGVLDRNGIEYIGQTSGWGSVWDSWPEARYLSINKPAGVQQNDTLICAISLYSAITVTPPAGWTLVASPLTNAYTKTWIWTRTAGSSEPASYRFHIGGDSGVELAYGMAAYRGCSTTAPILGVTSGAAQSGVSEISLPTVTTQAPNQVVLGLWATGEGMGMPEDPQLSTGPSGMTNRFSVAYMGGVLRLYDMQQPVPDTVSGKKLTYTGGTVSGAGIAIILKEPGVSHLSLKATIGGNVSVTGAIIYTGVNFRSYAGSDGISIWWMEGPPQFGLAKPTGTVAGDLMLAVCIFNSTSMTITPPPGWNLVKAENRDSQRMWVFSRIADASDDGTSYYYFTASEADKYGCGGIYTYFGADTAAPINASGAYVNTWGVQQYTANLTTTVSGTHLFAVWGASSSWTGISAGPTGFTRRSEQIDNWNYNNSFVVYDGSGGEAGAQGQKIAYGDEMMPPATTSIIVAIAPAAGGGSGVVQNPELHITLNGTITAQADKPDGKEKVAVAIAATTVAETQALVVGMKSCAASMAGSTAASLSTAGYQQITGGNLQRLGQVGSAGMVFDHNPYVTIDHSSLGVQAGDGLIMLLGITQRTVNITPPAGWTLLENYSLNPDFNSLLVYYRTVQAGDPTSEQWELPPWYSYSMTLIAYRGQKAGNFIDPGYTKRKNSSVTSHTVTGIASTAEKSEEVLAVVYAGLPMEYPWPYDFQEPAGYTVVAERFGNDMGGGVNGMGIYAKTVDAKGSAVANATVGTSGVISTSSAMMLGILPAIAVQNYLDATDPGGTTVGDATLDVHCQLQATVGAVLDIDPKLAGPTALSGAILADTEASASWGLSIPLSTSISSGVETYSVFFDEFTKYVRTSVDGSTDSTALMLEKRCGLALGCQGEATTQASLGVTRRMALAADAAITVADSPLGRLIALSAVIAPDTTYSGGITRIGALQSSIEAVTEASAFAFPLAYPLLVTINGSSTLGAANAITLVPLVGAISANTDSAAEELVNFKSLACGWVQPSVVTIEDFIRVTKLTTGADAVVTVDSACGVATYLDAACVGEVACEGITLLRLKHMATAGTIRVWNPYDFDYVDKVVEGWEGATGVDGTLGVIYPVGVNVAGVTNVDLYTQFVLVTLTWAREGLVIT